MLFRSSYRIEPAVCPEYGEQSEVYIDGCGETIENVLACTPGICSGCLIEGSERCIPYGFRLDVDGVNSYCEIDGELLGQKPAEESCQNNYECSSNSCSDGVCLDVAGAIEEASTLRDLFLTMWCRIGNIFDGTGYEQCLADFGIGESNPIQIPENYLILEDIPPFEFEDYQTGNLNDDGFVHGAEYKFNETLGENLVTVFTFYDPFGADTGFELLEEEIVEEFLNDSYDVIDVDENALIFSRIVEQGRDFRVFVWTSGEVGVVVYLESFVSSDNLLDAYLDKYPSDLSGGSGGGGSGGKTIYSILEGIHEGTADD